MGKIKLVSWNMEWLNDLFVSGPSGQAAAWRADGDKPQHNEKTTVGARKALIKEALGKIEADVMVVTEGPSDPAEFALLFKDLAPGTWQTHLQRSKSLNGPQKGATTFTSLQNIGIAVRTDTGKFDATALTPFDAADAQNKLIHESTAPFFYDSGGNGVVEWFRYERLPAYAEVKMKDGAVFRVLGLHLKSKGIFEAMEWHKWWTMADANRERLLAQCRHFREAFLDAYLRDTVTGKIPLVVCGDINDGPGFDTSEMRLEASGVETLMGSVWEPDLTLGSALFDRLSDKDKARLNFEENYTTSFKDPIFDGQYQREWIDHLLYTRAAKDWVKDADILRVLPGTPGLQMYKVADHFPVFATISL
jgi:hypothetical protein